MKTTMAQNVRNVIIWGKSLTYTHCSQEGITYSCKKKITLTQVLNEKVTPNATTVHAN